MSEAEGNGPAFPRALMALKNKCHLKERLLKRFGRGCCRPPPFRAALPSGSAEELHPFGLPGTVHFYFPLCLALSGIFPFTTQPCEIRSVLLLAPNIPRQTDLHLVQTVANLELFFPISAAPFPSCRGDLPCCSLCLLSRCSLLCLLMVLPCPGDTEGEAKKKGRGKD